MKKVLLNSVLFLSIILMGFNSQAYDFVVSGTVTDDLGNAITNQMVTITVDNDSTSRYVAYTTGTGEYSILLNLTNDSSVVNIELLAESCWQYYTETIIVTQPGEEVVDFEVCSEVNIECDLSFYYVNPSPAEPLAIQFFPFLDGADTTSFTWNFGDGATSTLTNPTHLYAQAGEYTVLLTANNDECGTITFEDQVYVIEDSVNTERCFADFYFIFDSLNYNTVQFIDISYSEYGVSSWTWDFGDGETSNEQYPSHNYTEEGQYLVQLTIESGDACSATAEYYVWIGENQWYPEGCQALFITEYNNNDFLSVNFQDLSWGGDNAEIVAWQWNYGDGTGSSDQNPSHTYSTEGEYVVSLTIYTDSCSNTLEQVVYIEDFGNTGDCNAFFYPQFDSTAIAVQFYDLTMPRANTWEWEFGDGQTSNEQNPYHVYSEVGVYTVLLIAGSDSCLSAFEMEIVIFENPTDTKNVTYGGEILQAHAIHYDAAAGIEQTQIQNTFTLYPNPVNDVLNINFNKNVNAQIEIISITGQVIKRTTTENNSTGSINTSNLPKGVYFARININGETYSQKFIK